MKNILTTILVFFALGLNAQDRDTFTICNDVKIYTIQQDNQLSIMSNLNFLDEVDLNGVKGVAATVSIFPSKIDILLNKEFEPLQFTEDLLDTLSMFWCGELFERTSTGLSFTDKLITTYDTTIIEGLGLYVPNDSEIWNTGSIMGLFPIKMLKIQKYEQNSLLRFYASSIVEVFRLMPNTNAKCHPCPLQWIEINLREETEIFFVEKPK